MGVTQKLIIGFVQIPRVTMETNEGSNTQPPVASFLTEASGSAVKVI